MIVYVYKISTLGKNQNICTKLYCIKITHNSPGYYKSENILNSSCIKPSKVNIEKHKTNKTLDYNTCSVILINDTIKMIKILLLLLKIFC